MGEDFQQQIAMMGEAELDVQAQQLKRLLEMAGMDLPREVPESELNNIIKDVLKTYDPVQFGDKDGALFVTTSIYFQRQKDDIEHHR